MLPIEELVNGTLEGAARYLAEKSAQVRGGLSYREKRANQASDVLSSLGSQVTSNPILGKALLGGGLGAAVGAGSHLIGSDEDDPGGRRHGMFGKALTGGLAGAAIGGGLGAAQHYWPGNVGGGLEGAGGPGGGPGGRGGHGGEPGVFSMGKEKLKVSPSLLKERPELLEKMQELSSSPWHEKLPGKVLKFFTNNPFAPTSAKVLPFAGAADFALHHEGMRLGDRNWLHGPASALENLGAAPRGAANLWRRMRGQPTQAAGGPNLLERLADSTRAKGEDLQHKGWFPGMIHPEHSRNPAHMRGGIEHVLGNEKNFPQHGDIRETLQNISGDKDITLAQHGPPSMMELPGQPGQPATRQLGPRPTSRRRGREVLQDLADNPVGGVDTVATRSRMEKVPQEVGDRHMLVEKTIKEPHLQTISGETRGRLARIGAGLEAAGHAADPHLKELHPHGQPHVVRGPFSGDRVLPTGPFRGARGLKRLGLYGGAPAAEWLGRTYMTDVGKSRDLDELLREARRQGHVTRAEG